MRRIGLLAVRCIAKFSGTPILWRGTWIRSLSSLPLTLLRRYPIPGVPVSWAL